MLIRNLCFVITLFFFAAQASATLTNTKIRPSGEVEFDFSTDAQSIVLLETKDNLPEKIVGYYPLLRADGTRGLLIPAREIGHVYSYRLELKSCGSTPSGQRCSNPFYSNRVSLYYGKPPAPDYIATSPQILTCAGSFTLEWSALSGSYYRIEERSKSYSTHVWGGWVTLADRHTTNTFTLPADKTNGMHYQYRVQSFYPGTFIDSQYSDFKESYEFYKPRCSGVSGSGNDNAYTVVHAFSLNGAEAANDLQMSPANEHQISYNKLPSFNVTSKVRIFTGISSVPPKLIIIESSEINLSHEIELVGHTADLLIISRGATDTLTCTACKFTNFGRVTLAMAQPAVSLLPGVLTVGELVGNRDAKVKLNNVYANGINSFEVLAGKIELIPGSVITTNLKASRLANGEYQINPTGTYVAGAGQVSLFMAGLGIDYESLTITRALPRQLTTIAPETVNLNGNIESAGISIAAFDSINSSAALDTRSHVVVFDSYRSEVTSPLSNIGMQSFSRLGLITLSGAINSDNEANVRSGGDLHVYSQIAAKRVQLIAGEKILNTTNGNIQALNMARDPGYENVSEIQLGANNIENLGYIFSPRKLSLAAQENIYNQYGGVLQGASISIESPNGIIRNGALTPYIVQGVHGGEISSTERYGKDYELGTFYRINAQLNANKILAPSQKAKIIANNVKIRGRAFENINPYFQMTGGAANDAVQFDSHRLEQVSLIATQTLDIKTTNSVTNSSAVLGVNQPNGMLTIETKLLTNERYLASFSLNTAAPTTQSTSVGAVNYYCGSASNTGYCTDYNATIHTISEITKDYAAAMAPPGDLFSMGNFKVTTQTGLLNRFSFIEVVGDAEFIGPIKNIGVKRTFQNRLYKYTPKDRAMQPDWQSKVETYSSRDSLLQIRGDTYGPQSQLTTDQEDPFTDLKARVATDSNFLTSLWNSILAIWNTFKDFFN